MIVTHHLVDIPPVDAIIVLGRGVEGDGTLSDKCKYSAEVAVELAHLLVPRVVVFSGGRSWQQVQAGEMPPAEGARMRELAMDLDGSNYGDVPFEEETESTSTVENFVNSASLLNLRPGDRLGILSDRLHHRFGRPMAIGKLVLPGVKLFPFEVPDISEPRKIDIIEEAVSAAMTKIFMFGVEPGNVVDIMSRQRKIEKINSLRPNITAPKAA
jgi:DUF218 domain